MANEYVGDARALLIGVESAPDATTGETTLNYIAVENETSTSQSGENEEVDISSKGAVHAKILPGQASDSISLECYAIDGNTPGTAQNRLLTARRNREMVYLQLASRDVSTGNVTPIEENTMYITSVELSYEMNEAVSLSVEGTLLDFWAPVAA